MATLRNLTVSNASGFSPSKLQAMVGDAATWHNDDSTDHQPYPVGGKPGDWGPAITGNNSSEQLDLGTAGVFAYTDANNAALKGSIAVANLVQIGPVFGQPTAALVPSTKAVNVGTTVIWQNSDSAPHQPQPVGGPATAWFAQPIAAGAYSAPVAFNTAGSISYNDALNPSVTTLAGTLTVSATTVTIAKATTAFGTATVTVGYAVTFQNNDTAPHQPAPSGGPATAWFASPIAAGASGTTPVLNSVGNLNYADALNAKITGVLQVVGK